MTLGWGRKVICVASNACLLYFGLTLLTAAYDCARTNKQFAHRVHVELRKLGFHQEKPKIPDSVHVSTCSKIYTGGCYMLLVAAAGLVGAMYDFTILLRMSAIFYAMLFTYALYNAIELYHWRISYTQEWKTVSLDKWFEKTYLRVSESRQTISTDIWNYIFALNIAQCKSMNKYRRRKRETRPSSGNLTIIDMRKSGIDKTCKEEIIKTQGNVVLIVLVTTSIFALGGAATARDVIRLRCSCQGAKYRNMSRVPYITIGTAPQAPPHLGCVLRSALLTHTYRLMGPTWRRARPCPREDTCKPVDCAGLPARKETAVQERLKGVEKLPAVERIKGEDVEYPPKCDETILQIPC